MYTYVDNSEISITFDHTKRETLTDMTTATQLLESAKKDVNQKLVIDVISGQIYWTPSLGINIHMRAITNNERFGASPKTVREIGGMPSEVVEIRNHQLPYESEFKIEDFSSALSSAVRTGAIHA